jgi:regulator of cell morphogenesis and NO signaling
MGSITQRTVGKLAVEIPAATQVFEKLGIDYGCGGNKTLEQACRAADLVPEQVVNYLEAANGAARTALPARDWQTEPLSELIAHIKSQHHKFTRDAIARLGSWLEKVCSVDGQNHPELLRISATFGGLAQELATHMMKEELVLFPYIVRLEEAVAEKAPVLPAPFGSVRNPVAMMIHEHHGAGDMLRDMRQAGNGYTVPADACVSYRTLYAALAEFEADLHQHIHLENNILFPRAVEMEKEAAGPCLNY